MPAKRLHKTPILILIVGILVFGSSVIFKQNLQPSKIQLKNLEISKQSSSKQFKKEDLLNQIQSENLDYKQEMQNGINYFQKQEFRLAISHFVKANKLNKTESLPYVLSAEAYLNLDKPELAEKNLYAASFKSNYGLYGKLIEAQYYIYSRENAKAIASLNFLSPQYADVQFLQAIFYLNTHQIEQAKLVFENLSRNQINNPYYYLANVFLENHELYLTFRDSPVGFLQVLFAKQLLNSNQIVSARALTYTALKENNLFRDAWLTLGYSFLKAKENLKAFQTLEKTRKLDPYHSQTHLYLGITHFKINNFNSAIHHLKLSLNYETKDPNLAQEFLGHSYFASQNFENANDIYKNLINNQYINPYVLANLCQIYLKESDFKQATSLLQLFKDKFGFHDLYSYNLAHLYLLTKNFPKSIQYLENTLKINPISAEAYFLLAQNHKLLNNPNSYKSNLSKALALASANKDMKLYQKIINEIQE